MAAPRICSIEICDKPHYARGWCKPHWAKWYKYGDPLAGKNRVSKGVPLAWLLAHASYQGDDCLKWPFATGSHGYGDLWIDGKHVRANRHMCEIAHGLPPSPSHEALHTCGNGHLGCTNPRHLRWGTSKENSADTIEHGTLLRGEAKPNAKLTRDAVLEIRRLIASGISQSNIAKRFSVCQQTICNINRRKLWGWL
jgi:hypothetical protein